jgi:hypothetical protein
MHPELLELGPRELGPAGPILSLSPGEAALLAPDHPFLQHGEWRAFAGFERGTLGARLVASIDPRQSSNGMVVGCIGFATASDEGTPAPRGPATARVLAAALGWLRGRRVSAIRCPVQFSTWYGHRAITDGFPDQEGAPAFFLEPRSDRGLVDLLLANGFVPAHRAVSYAVDPEAVIGSARSTLGRLRRAGLDDRPFRAASLEEELRLLHRLSSDTFRASWGFSEISLDEFGTIYRPLADLADPELVRILETADGQPVGFGFAMPDGADRPGSGRFIVKSLGLLPVARRRYPGAGVGLAALVHRAASDRGYAGGIHALMTEGSMAHRLSMRWGTRLRSYATFVRVFR